LLPGLSAGLQLIAPGGRIELLIPPSLGYGNRAAGGIPPGAGLVFDVTLIAVE
jgi:peptidylprolyl isomerase